MGWRWIRKIKVGFFQDIHGNIGKNRLKNDFFSKFILFFSSQRSNVKEKDLFELPDLPPQSGFNIDPGIFRGIYFL